MKSSTMAPRGRRGWSAWAAVGLLAAACQPSANELGHLRAERFGDLTYAPAPRREFATDQRTRCGDGGETDLGAGHILRSPYLQKVTHQSAEVLWTADVAGARVDVRTPDGSLVASTRAIRDDHAAVRGGVQLVARLDGLDPDNLYCYEIVDESGALLVRRTGFVTAPMRDVGSTIRFVALGDLGKRTGDQFAVLSALKTVDFDFGLIAGDVAYDSGTLTEFEKNYFAVYHDVIDKSPFFSASGNHEYKTADAEPFRSVFSLFENGGPDGVERWYSFDWGDVHFVVLDTERVGAVQAAWLDRDLETNDRPWTVVVAHRPPFSSGHHGSHEASLNVFHPLLAKHGVQLVLNGHEHHYERVNPVDGVTYVVTGGGGQGTRPVGESWFTGHSERVAHFVYVTVDAEKLRLYAIDATGTDFDTLELRLEDT